MTKFSRNKPGETSRLGKSPVPHGLTERMIPHFPGVKLHNSGLCGLLGCRSQRMGASVPEVNAEKGSSFGRHFSCGRHDKISLNSPLVDGLVAERKKFLVGGRPAAGEGRRNAGPGPG